LYDNTIKISLKEILMERCALSWEDTIKMVLEEILMGRCTVDYSG
jgi:hypothetical protein